MRDATLTIEQAFPASILDHVGDGELCLGIDLGTTEGKRSNPTAFALTESLGLIKALRCAARFKTTQRDVIQGVLERFILLLNNRGRRLKVVVLDGTNERLTAVSMQQDLAGQVTLRIAVLGSTRLVFGEKVTLKTFVFGLVANHLEDGRLLLPPADWIKKDLRQPVREKGTFTSAVAEDGSHADLFCAIGLALDGHESDGPVQADAVQLGTWGQGAAADDDDDESPNLVSRLLTCLGF